MKLLSAQDIIKAQDLKTVDVEVPEWGGTVRLKEMSAQIQSDYEREIFEVGDDGKNQLRSDAKLRESWIALLDLAASSPTCSAVKRRLPLASTR